MVINSLNLYKQTQMNQHEDKNIKAHRTHALTRTLMEE